MPILKAFGFFLVLVAAFSIYSVVIMGLMGVGGMLLVPELFIGSGLLTVATGIIAAIMAYHQWEAWKYVEIKNTETDHEYRMELLEKANGMEEEDAQVQLESSEYTFSEVEPGVFPYS